MLLCARARENQRYSRVRGFRYTGGEKRRTGSQNRRIGLHKVKTAFASAPAGAAALEKSMNIGSYTFDEFRRLAENFHGYAAPGLLVGGYMVELHCGACDHKAPFHRA